MNIAGFAPGERGKNFRPHDAITAWGIRKKRQVIKDYLSRHDRAGARSLAGASPPFYRQIKRKD